MLKLINVTKIYTDNRNSSVTALHDVDLELPQTGLVVLTGSSGCGKTTLLNILGGLDRPTTGELYFEQLRVDDKEESWWDAFRSTVLGFVFQDYNLLENMTVRENIRLPLALYNLTKDAEDAKIKDITDGLGLHDYLDKKAGKLSGGQKQRVAIARALVSGAKIILADEPTGNLDKENSENVFTVLKEIARERLVVVVTHDTSLAAAYADRLIQLAYGTIESDSAAEAVVTDVPEQGEHKKNVQDKESMEAKNEKRRLPLKECFVFAKEAMSQRKMRCVVSALTFGITMLLILIACEVLFRDDSLPISCYVNKENQKVLPLYMSVPNAYSSVAVEDRIKTGRKLYNLLSQNIDEGRIVRYSEIGDIECEKGRVRNLKGMFVTKKNESYFSYKGTFPEEENEIAVSEEVAEKIQKGGDIVGEKILWNGREYTITAVVREICGVNLEEIYVDDGFDENMFENMAFFPAQVLTADDSHGLYLPGFSVTQYSNLYYQTMVYNEIYAVSEELELVAGRMPEKNNEILISQDLLEQRNQTVDEVVGKTYTLSNIYEEKYGCTYWNEVNLYDILGEKFMIVGVAEGEGEYYVAASLYEEISKEYNAYYSKKYCLLWDEDFLRADVQAISENDIKIEGDDFEKVYSLIENINALRTGMVLMVFVLVFLALLQMISLYSYSINDSKKTIGVLRTLGIDKSDIKKIFSVECIVVSLFAFVIALGFSFFVTMGINHFIDKEILGIEEFAFLRMRLPVVFVAGAVSIVMSVLSVVIPVKRYSKFMVMELIR